ncbi:VCBS domain-containing protein [Psychrobacter sp. NPDC078409]|uniref:VCBS domain-containing protein n=1 Tax=Psychrobacter sp. NPDC078409 TaxID=3390660 RepID=UPI003CFF0512
MAVPLIGDDIDGTVASVTVLQVPPTNQGVLTYEDDGQTVELTPGTVLTADQITSVVFTPAPNFNGRVSNIQFSTTDDDGAISAPATVEITVTPVVDITYVVITGDENVIEGKEAEYTVKFLDESGNPVVVTQATDVTVIFNNVSTQDADTGYNNAQTITVTIPTGQSSVALDVDTIDDYLADDGENYSLTITSVGANEFEAVDFSDEATNTVTTTIDSNNAGDSANEGGLDSNDVVYVKLTGDDSQVEADDAVLTHTLSLVDADGQPVVLPVSGSVVVNLSYLNDETTAVDFDASSKLTTVTFNASTGNQIILTNRVLNDQLKEGIENYQLSISSVDGTNSGFESVQIVTENSVTGQIVDDVDLKPDVNTVQEDGILTATGNVLANDEVGTETSVSLQSQPSDANDYGALTLNNDGSYTYVLNNNSSTVQALARGEAVEQVFTYRVGDDTQTLTITVTGTNDAPTLDVSDNSNTTANYATAYQEGGVPVAISDSSAIADIDNNDTIGNVLIVLTNSQTGDLIAIEEGDLPAGISATLLGNSRIELSGSASLADYQSAIDAITFANTSATPSEIDRIIEVTVTDINNANSNTTTTVISVDATPQAVDDTAQVTEGGKTISSNTTSLNLLTNDDLGTPNTTITSFTYLDENGISQTGVTGSVIDTQYGSLTINANGTWSYTSDDTSDNLNGIIDSISYTITDADGDTSSADFNITVDDTQPTALIPEVTLNEDDLTGGTDTTPDALRVTRNLGITKAADDISDVIFTGVTTAGLEALALESNGEPLTYQVSNDGHTMVASAIGSEVFTITLTNPTDSTGDAQAFIFELQGQLDHTDGVTITLPVKYEIQDTDSATVQQFNVNIADDKVLATDDTPVSVVEGSYVDGDDSTLLTGNVLDNDKGADADLKINTFTYLDTDGNTVEDSTDFGVGLETPTGILTVNEDGSWTFAANKEIDNRDPAPNLQDDGSFSYTLIDADGDVSDAAEQPISVTDTAPVIESDESVVLKEGDLFPDSGTASTYVVKVDSAFTVTGNEDNISDIYFIMGDGDPINGRFQSSGLPLYYRYAEVDGVIDYSTLYVSTTQRGDLIADTVDNPNNNVIFKVEINPEGLPYTSADALTYTATLYDTIRHDNIDANNDGRLDNIIFDLDYAVVDEDGSITEDQFDVEVENRLFNKDLDFTINEGDFADLTEDENIAPNGKDALLINAAENFDGGVVTILNYDLSSSIDLQSGEFIYIDVNGNAINTDDQNNPAIVGSLRNIGNGQIEFNPEENYSSIATPNDRADLPNRPSSYEQTPNEFNDFYSVMFNLRAQDGGQTLTSRINIEVDPVADAPIIVIDAAEVDIVDGVYTNYVEEDSSTQLGFIAPIIGDNGVEASTDLSIYDPNYVNGTKRENDDNINGGSVDRTERFGAITLSGLPEGAQLSYIDGSGTQQIIIARTGDDGTVTIKLTDGTHIADSEFTADVEMTSDQFESLIVFHPDQDATNFTVTMSVTEYEVDENGVPYPLEPNDSSSVDPDSSLIAETTSVDILIDVQAVTDTTVIDLLEPVALPPSTTSITLSDEPNNGIDKNDTINAVIDEDSSLDLQSILNETFVDTDGSEEYWYSIEGLGELNGQVVTVNGVSYTVADGTVELPRAQVTAEDLDPSFTFTPPADFAGVINATLTLNTRDSDSDSIDVNPAIQIEQTSVQLNITVNPTIDVTVVDPQVGDEDAAIALFTINDAGDSVFTITDQDSSETLSIVGILKDQIDDLITAGAEISLNGTPITTADLTDEGLYYGFNVDSLDGYTITPPAHSSADIALTYFVETTDGSVDSDNPITDNDTFDVTIKVTPVAESANIDSDGGNGTDVTLNPDHTYAVPAFEDGDDDGVSSSAPVWYDLSTDAGFILLNGWSNEDDTNDFGEPSHNNNRTDSEETFARLIVQIKDDNGDWVNASGAQFRYDIAGEPQTVTAGKNGVDVPVAGLSSLAFIPPNNYSGELRIQEQAVTIDYDEDDDTATDKVLSGESFLYLTVTPVADDVLLSVQPAQGVEDAGRSNGNPTGIDGYTPADTIDTPEGGIELKIKAQSKDTDGSETFNITIDALPDGASLYVWDADNSTNGGYVLINQNYGTVNDIATVDNAGITWSVTLTDYQNDKVPFFIPPLNSNDNYTLLVSGVSVDGADTSEPSTPLALPIKITTVADKILNDELNEVTFDYDGQASDSYAVILEESDLDAADNEIDFNTIFQTPEAIRSYDNDGSEVVTYVITGLDDRFTMQGADVTFIGGQGTARQWVVTDEAINNGEIVLKTEDNFAGEINFNIKGVSTEKTGGSEASQNIQPVQIFVKPDALDNDVVNPTAVQNENASVTLDFERAFRRTDNTDNWTSGVEELNSMAISLTDLEALGVQLTVGSIDGVGGVVITTDQADTEGFYTIIRGSNGEFNASIEATAAEPASAQSGFVNHKSGNDVYQFGIKYTVTDTVRATNNETADIVYQTTLTRDTNFVVDVLPITDAPSLVNLAEIETSETIDIVNADTADDEFIKTVTLTSPDLDGSEVFTRVQVGGVPDGILVQVDANGNGTFVDAVKAGDTWYVVFDDETIDTSITASVDIKFSVKAGYDVDNAENVPITVTAYNQDAPDVEQLAQAIFDLTLVTGTDGGGEVPPELVADLIVQPITLTEDGAGQSLNNFIVGTLNQVAYDNQMSAPISFTIANLPDDVVLESSNGVLLSKQGSTWLISGNVTSDSDIAELLSNISIVPTSDYSTNNQSEAVNLDISFTATDSNGDSETVTADDPAFPIGDPGTNDSTLIVLPITDYFSFHEDDPTAPQNDDNIVIEEDAEKTLTLNLTNTVDVGNVEVIGGNVYLQFADSASINGTLRDTNGEPLDTVSNPTGLPVGTYFALPVGTDNPTSVSFNFVPEPNEDGATAIEAYVVHKETTDISDHDTTTLVSRKDFEITVEKGADPLLFVVNEAASNLTVDEDQGEIGVNTDINVVSIVYDTVQTDEDDQPATFILDNVNDNFTVYYVNDSGDIVIANKTGTGSWSLPSTEINPTPEIFIQAPENYSGTSSANVSVLSTDGLQGDATTVALVFKPIADGVELTPQNSASDAYTWVALNTNAKMEDTDSNGIDEGGSETLTLTITPESDKPFDETMLFRIGDTGEVIGLRNAEVDSDGISVEFVAGSYVLSGVPSSSINDIQILYQAYNGTITYTGKTVETSDPEQVFSSEEIKTADLNLSESVAIETGEQNDTITTTNRSTTVNSGAGDDRITGGAGDDFLDGGTGINTLIGGAGNDTLVFSADNTLMDGGNGIDTLLINVNNTTIDFGDFDNSVIDNMEVIDLTGNDAQSLINIGTNDVITMTDSNNELFINGDDEDEVSLTADFVAQQVSDQADYTQYQSTIDPTVNLYVHDDITIL